MPPPFAISISLLGVHGAILGIGDDLAEQYPLDRHSFKLPIQIIPAFGDDVYYRSALSPAVDALWNAVGFPTAEDFLANYNAEGEWAPNG